MTMLSDAERAGIRRILVLKMSALGDIAKTIPTVEALRSAFPQAEIAWVVRRGLHDLLEGCPAIDRLFAAPRGLAALRETAPALRRFRPDIALDMQGLLVSSSLAALSGAPLRYTWATNRELSGLLCKAVVPAPEDKNAVECLFNFARLLGVEKLPDQPPAYLTQAPELCARAEALLHGLPRPLAGMHIGASTANKTWPPQRWAELIELLLQEGISCVLFGANAEKEAEKEILQQTGERAGLRSLVGRTTPRELAAAIAQCNVFLGGDTGATHIASLVHTPIVGLMGATDPLRVGPFGEQHHIISLHLPCSPCYRHPTCGGAYTCMSSIDALRVLNACRMQLRKSSI